jgi:SAM-dependent methyltransferase
VTIPTNPFVVREGARRYRRYRPDYSPHLAAILADTVGSARTALDIAAGTGISTAAVRSVATQTVAIDASPSMVAEAEPRPDTAWVIAGAESLPFRSATFDLIAVGSALHWFHRDAFVGEATRVATDNCCLVVHDHGFTGQMEGIDDFGDWVHHRYLRGYPKPTRAEKLAPGSDLGPFRFDSTHRYDHVVEVTRDTLAGYLTTQSNLQAVMSSAQAAADVLGWLEKELNPFFLETTTRAIRFAGMATVLYRT